MREFRLESPCAALQVNDETLVNLSALEKFKGGRDYKALLAFRSGRFALSGFDFYFTGFDRFVEDLENAHGRLDGRARLETEYEGHFLEIEFTARGHVQVRGKFAQYAELHQEIFFGFECDQSYVSPFIAALREARSTLNAT